MLRRALQSLICQSEERWRAIILDDSPNCEGHDVVKKIGDSRMIYCPNPKNIGAAANIDQSFQTAAYEGAQYAFVLEDDNEIDKNFISQNIKELETSGYSIILRNQRICFDHPLSGYENSGLTTRGHIFSHGPITRLNLRASLAFCEGISNGGLFWRTDMNAELRVGFCVTSAAMQEHVRTLKILEPIFFASQPLATFSLPVDGNTTRDSLSDRIYNRGRQNIIRKLYEMHGNEFVCAADMIVHSPDLKAIMRRNLADALIERSFYCNPLQAIKGFFKIAFVTDPLAEFWNRQAMGGNDVVR